MGINEGFGKYFENQYLRGWTKGESKYVLMYICFIFHCIKNYRPKYERLQLSAFYNNIRVLVFCLSTVMYVDLKLPLFYLHKVGFVIHHFISERILDAD